MYNISMPRYAWNKGLKGKQTANAGSFKKGEHRNKATEFKKGLIPWNKGIPRNEETKQKIRETKAIRKYLYTPRTGELNPMWKKDRDIGYTQKHRIMRKAFVNIKECQNCGSIDDLEIANISGKYLLNINDWKKLCISCHKKYDNIVRNFKGVTPWSKK